MTTEKLIRMANQIADFFRLYPEGQAVQGIRDHLMAFWTPRMRSALLACSDPENAMLNPLVRKALLDLGSGKSPIEKEIAGPQKVGELGSDAG